MNELTITRFGTSSAANETTVLAHVTEQLGAITRVVGDYELVIPGTYAQVNDYLLYEVTTRLLAAGCSVQRMKEPTTGKADATPFLERNNRGAQ
jgi:hypothetical protein